MNTLKEMYKKLKKKYGSPKDQWSLWCKRPKTKKEKEEVIKSFLSLSSTIVSREPPKKH